MEALHAECNTLREATAKAVSQRDASHRANLKLRMESLTGMVSSATITTLRERCTKAEARVKELLKENSDLKEINADQSRMLDNQELTAITTVGASTTSAALRPLSFSTLGGMESGLPTQTSPQLRGGMSGLRMPRASPLLLMGQGDMANFAGPVMAPAGFAPFPSPRVGSGRCHMLSPGPYLETSSVTAI